LGTVAAITAAALLCYGLVLQVFYAPVGSRDHMPLLALFIGAFGTYEIWAYFHGRATSVDHMIHEPRPENTLWRTLGLVGDLFFIYIALAMLYDLR
jgi:CDP-diglyceride synthetase